MENTHSSLADAKARIADLERQLAAALAVAEKTGAKIEVFMLRELNRDSLLWDVIVDPARKIRIGNKLYFGKDDELVAEVIESKVKPTVPWGSLGETAFGAQPAAVDRGDRRRVIVAVGRQDIDPDGLVGDDEVPHGRHHPRVE